MDLRNDVDYGEEIILMAWENLKRESPNIYDFLKQHNVKVTYSFNYTGYDAWISFELFKYHYGATVHTINLHHDKKYK